MPIQEAKTDFINFLKNNAIWMALVLVAIIAISIFIILYANSRKKKISFIDVLIYLGGKDNISGYELKGSRLSLSLLDSSKIDETSLKSNGVSSVIKMSNKVILVLDSSLKFYKNFENGMK